MNDRQLGAVLAGLRALQNVQQHEALAPEIVDVMTNGGSFAPLDDDEIDALCEELNAGETPPGDLISRAALLGPFRRSLERCEQGERDNIDDADWPVMADMCRDAIRAVEEAPAVDSSATPLATVQLYRRLADGLSDMVEEGRLTEADIPDDHGWLTEALAQIAEADPGDSAPIEAVRSQFATD